MDIGQFIFGMWNMDAALEDLENVYPRAERHELSKFSLAAEYSNNALK